MSAADAPAERAVHEVVQDIARTRADLGLYLAEFDRRRHEALDWKLQLRRHRVAVTLLGAGIALAAGFGVAALVKVKRNGKRRR